MGTNDGHRIVSGAGGRQGMVPCSRWEELGASISWHARLAVELGAWTEFRMLNPPSGAPQHVVVGTTVGSHDPTSVQELRTIDGLVASPPTGRTPLCAQIRSVTAQIAARAGELRATGTKACVVIASDGEATDGDIAAALRPLRDLPAWVVIRLCTDEDRVVQYWNQIDEDLELDMDVPSPRGYFSDESRRRRGRDVDIPRRQVAAAPRPPRGYSAEAGRGDATVGDRSRTARASGT